MRNDNEVYLPQRYRKPEKDTRIFYEKTEWWQAFVKWGIVAVLLTAGLAIGGTFCWSKYSAYRHRKATEAQAARLREIDEAKEREAREKIEREEREAKAKARAAEKAEKERQRQERLAAEEERKAAEEARQQELASREKAPRILGDLVRMLDTAGVRWWGSGTPPKFASRKPGDEYWCVFAAADSQTIVRVKVGETNGVPAAIDISDGTGYFHSLDAELFERDVATKPHLVMMDRAAWIRLPKQQLERAAHTSVPDPFNYRAGETLVGEELYRIVRNSLHRGDRLAQMKADVEFHWRGEARAPIKWTFGFEENFQRVKLSRAIEEVLKAELAAKETRRSAAAAAPEKKRSTLSMNGPSIAPGGTRNARRLGDNYRALGGGTATTEKKPEAPANAEPEPERERVTSDDIKRAMDEGYLCAKCAE